MSKLIAGVGLFGPLAVFVALVALDVARSFARHPDYDAADSLAIPKPWTFALFCATSLAIADPLVAAIGYHAPLAILARTALAGALTGSIAGTALGLGDGAGLMLARLLWPISVALFFALHMGALWLLL